MRMILQRIEINIAKEFTDTPGPRYRYEGDHSGEQFRDEMLRQRFVSAIDSRSMLLVNLDGAVGYPSSFLEEAFGGLAREFGSAEVEKSLEFTCNDEPYLEEQIRQYIRDANRQR
jgi:hypothetical protein